jgi:hypothetical protein
VNIRAFPTFQQDRREVQTATVTSGSLLGGTREHLLPQGAAPAARRSAPAAAAGRRMRTRYASPPWD